MRLLLPGGALIASVLALAACGGSGNSSSGSSGASASTGSSNAAASNGYGSSAPSSKPASTSSGGGLTVKAQESNGLSFDVKTLKAKAGTVKLTMDNPSGNSLPHGISIEGNGVDKSGTTVSPGGTATVTANLKPGTYTFYCPVPGHRQAGMKGTLTVS